MLCLRDHKEASTSGVDPAKVIVDEGRKVVKGFIM